MDSASGLLALLDRGPGLALPPGAARRFAPPLNDSVLIKRIAIRTQLSFLFGSYGFQTIRIRMLMHTAERVFVFFQFLVGLS